MTDDSLDETPRDQCEDPENCLIHGPEPKLRDILCVEGFEVTHGYLQLPYGGGLDEETLELFENDEGLVPATYIRLHSIDPQTGAKVNLTFAMAPFMGHGMGVKLAEASFHKVVRLPHVWEPAQASPDSPAEHRVTASWEGWKVFMEGQDEEDED